MDCGDFKAIRMFARKLERTCVLPVDLKVSDGSTPASITLHCA
jgi:antitoxin component of RelBE/YafQ-DinJ toxin-antitoxin module